MNPQQLEILIQKVKKFAQESLQKGDAMGWFDRLYEDAQGDTDQIPWAKLTTHPYLENWLEKKQISGQDKKALVTGCGLGDDAEALAKIGYDVTAFDISPTAIAWCKQRFPESKVNYLIADLFALEPTWKQQFDLVFESKTIQALPLEMRTEIIEKIADLVAQEGTLLIITRIRDTEATPPGPPWALSEAELNQFKPLGFKEIERTPFIDPNNPSIPQIRIEYQFSLLLKH